MSYTFYEYFCFSYPILIARKNRECAQADLQNWMELIEEQK